MTLRLGINIDHVATLRNARGGAHPDLTRAAQLTAQAGADGLTIHLREDRRHIRDADVFTLRNQNLLPMNLEMAATDEMQHMACQVMPNAVCLVPEKREELTTEGGLDVAGQQARLASFIEPLKAVGIRVSLFIDPDEKQIQAAYDCHADIVELHTGAYAEGKEGELVKLQQAARIAAGLGLEVHAGHGLTYENVKPIASIRELVELNIGHFLVGEALFVGFVSAIQQIRKLMDEARA